MVEKRVHDLDILFHPKSVAMIGASPRPRSTGRRWITAYINLGFQGKIFPVNPSSDYTLGFKTYASVLDIPDEIDLAMFAIPSSG